MRATRVGFCEGEGTGNHACVRDVLVSAATAFNFR